MHQRQHRAFCSMESSSVSKFIVCRECARAADLLSEDSSIHNRNLPLILNVNCDTSELST